MPGIQRPARSVESVSGDPLPSDIDAESIERLNRVLEFWSRNPADFVIQAIGVQPDPWQCDVMDAVIAEDNVALRACHGVGKSTLLAWLIFWFTTTRSFPKLPTTAPTYNKQVKDVLWAEVHKWWRSLEQITPWLAADFDIRTTRLQHAVYGEEWFAVGIASSQPLNIEGYHSPHLLAIFDEAKAIGKATWEAVMGMRTTQEAKLVVASTPGGPLGEFFKVFTEYRETWKSLFVIHPETLRSRLKRRESPPHSLSGTYYSKRVREQWVRDCQLEWGEDSPVYIARVVGDFPTVEGDVLIPYQWIVEAMDREQGAGGPRIVACDVARYGRDRTVILAGEGGTLLHGETIARTLEETTSPEGMQRSEGQAVAKRVGRAIDVTADACIRVRNQFNAAVIVVDETGLGGGLVDILKRRGERVVPLNFGVAPTDRPTDAEDAKSRARRHVLDSKYVNLKAEMGYKLRAAFEMGWLALANLPEHITNPLVAQTSMIKQEYDSKGRIRIIDPDEQDELEIAAGTIEGRRSPDHFHAMLLYWWVAGGQARSMIPRAGVPQIPEGVARIGERRGAMGAFVGQARQAAAGVTGGQASWVRRWYR